MVEHILGRFAEIDDPFAERRRLDAEGHVLRIVGAGGVIIAADAADAAGDEMRVARILALHEDAIAAEDRRRAVALGHLLVLEVDLGEDAQAAHDPGDWIPRFFDELSRARLALFFDGSHRVTPIFLTRRKGRDDSRWSGAGRDGATSAPY
jgi:hypothetical protein